MGCKISACPHLRKPVGIGSGMALFVNDLQRAILPSHAFATVITYGTMLPPPTKVWLSLFATTPVCLCQASTRG